VEASLSLSARLRDSLGTRLVKLLLSGCQEPRDFQQISIIDVARFDASGTRNDCIAELMVKLLHSFLGGDLHFALFCPIPCADRNWVFPNFRLP
jgi:hypothetical protein